MSRSRRWWAGIGLGAGLLILLALLLPGPIRAGMPAPDAEGTPTPVPTATPTTVPFLQPPFARTYRVTSHFDHQLPIYERDDTVIIFNGDQASAIDGMADRLATFPGGYWFPDTFAYLYYDGHNGVDYGTGGGTTVLAAAPGEVVFAGSAASGCDTPLQYVCIEHEGGYRTFYLHLEGIAVVEDEWVEAGDPVGISGNSGCSLAAHLHFAVDRDKKATDPYGWQPADRPDPLIAYSDAQATWLWLPEAPPLPTGKLTHPPKDTKTNGTLDLVFVPDTDSPPVARVTFVARYGEAWHTLGTDESGADGWRLAWDTRDVPEGEVWLHAWVSGAGGRLSKGSPIRSDVTVDRHAPVGTMVGLEPGSTVGGRLWLYAASHDPASDTERVTLVVRELGGAQPWREIGDATWLHTSNWLFEWDADVPDGTALDIAARLTDGAGNTVLTQPVTGVLVDRSMPGGELRRPRTGTPFTTTLDLAFAPFGGSAPVHRVSFWVWHDGAWHEAGEGQQDADGWYASWDPAPVEDQGRIRVQARVYDALGRANTALPQVTDLTLDRTPPGAGYLRPRSGGVARPGVSLRAWAKDGGSGVDRVEFYVNEGLGWIKLGEDRYGEDGWSLPWEGREVADGIVDFGLRAYDRAGNYKWAKDEVDVALDRAPPEGAYAYPQAGMQLGAGAAITLTLDVTDTLSGLDRAVFYARYDGRWHHLGSDATWEDGLSVAWDTSAAGRRSGVSLTAWVYDRAGNHVELPHVEGLSIDGLPAGTPAAATPAPATETPSPTPTATPAAIQSPLPEPTPTAASPTATPTATSPAAVPPVATPAPTAAPLPVDLPFAPVPPAFWVLIGIGIATAIALIARSIRALRSS